MSVCLVCAYPYWLPSAERWVPCGNCGNCLRRKISDWTLRLKHEFKACEAAYFVTLTYAVNPVELSKRHVQLYFKRLRKAGGKFRYFACGDYGDTFGRPHYHVILFTSARFDVEMAHQIWGAGFTTFDRLTDGRIGYVVKYGLLARLDFDNLDRRQRPFFLMSRRPGLGYGYLSPAVRAFHKRSDVWYLPEFECKRPLPRYYKDRLFSGEERARHTGEFWVEAAEKFELKVSDAVRKFGAVGRRVIVERVKANADLYLASLRLQKKEKNKLL